MASNSSVRLYSQGAGAASSAQFPSNPVIQTRDPASTDVTGSFGQYPLGQVWINSSANTAFLLTSFSSSSGTVSATWISI